MTKNIKEIGKELLGKSLNSFHRKTGLTQLEENNKMQDGILNGILNQVDDAYIEKTEQSNVIHLEGSGDGVVALDSIEGNTMVNLFGTIGTSNIVTNYGNYNGFHLTVNTPNSWATAYFENLIKKTDTTYTYVVYVDDLVGNAQIRSHLNTASNNFNSVSLQKGLNMLTFRTDFSVDGDFYKDYIGYAPKDCLEGNYIKVRYVILLEGDWTNKEIPQYFKGLQSSFEESVTDEGQYKIEILSNNKNLYNVKDVNIGSWMNSGGATVSKVNDNIVLNGTISDYFDFRTVQNSWNPNLAKLINKLPVGTTLTMSNNLTSEKNTINYWSVKRDGAIKYFTNTLTIQKGDTEIGGFVRFQNGTVLNNTILKVQIEVNNKATNYTISKQNKIKLLLNEPLRSVRDVKDELCVKNGKLVVKRNIIQKYYNGTQGEFKKGWTSVEDLLAVDLLDLQNKTTKDFSQNIICDRFVTNDNSNTEGCYKYYSNTPLLSIPVVVINKNKLTTPDIEGFKVWLKNNPINVACVLEEPYYEEVLNEYGEPIILEGYENGTIYIDSTIVPTTSVRYTPKMQSFKTLKEVNNNNVMLTNDVNDNIIPYMMDVDLMIMEKEMALVSHKNIRTIGVKDMTSMQKRTQDMLERLIKGKTLTEQECKTRVTTYLNANKITDAQAEELMLLIDEVYA